MTTCDRCGHEFKWPETGAKIQIRATYLLCDACLVKLRRWINGPK